MTTHDARIAFLIRESHAYFASEALCTVRIRNAGYEGETPEAERYQRRTMSTTVMTPLCDSLTTSQIPPPPHTHAQRTSAVQDPAQNTYEYLYLTNVQPSAPLTVVLPWVHPLA